MVSEYPPLQRREPPPDCNPWVERHKRLLGKPVCVKLGVDENGKSAYTSGVLAAFDNEGGFMLRGEAELVTWCWPMLEVTEVCQGGCGCRAGTDDADRNECGCDGGCREDTGPQFMDNEKACDAPAGWKYGYLPCGCRNDGYGNHV